MIRLRPWDLGMKKGELTGFDVDLAREVARRLGIEVRFQPIDWDAKVLELNSGSIDMIWNGLSITNSRLKEMVFSKPYLENTQMVMVAKGSWIKNINDLEGLKVGAQITSAAQDAVEASSIYSKLGELVKFDNFNSALLELQNKTVDAVVIDEIMGRYIMSLNPSLYEALEDNFGEETYGIGFRLESSNLKDKIDETLASMIMDGKAVEISVKWFDEDIFHEMIDYLLETIKYLSSGASVSLSIFFCDIDSLVSDKYFIGNGL